MEAETQEKVIDAASGLTTIEAENAFALSVVESKAIDPVIVAKEKAQAVKKNGLLELIETKETLDSIGGLDVLKEWLLKRRHAFSQRAIEYGLPTPKGLLILGISWNWEIVNRQSHSQGIRCPFAEIGCRQDLRWFGRSVRIQPSGRHSNCRSHCALLPLD